MLDFIDHFFNELVSCLFACHSGYTLKGYKLFFLETGDLGSFFFILLDALVQSLVLFLKSFGLLVEGLFLGSNSAFLTCQLVAAFLDFALGLGAAAMDLVLRLQNGFALLGFA